VDTKETIAKIRAALNEVQKNGQELVSVPALLEYLSNLEANAPEAAELRKLQHESNLAQYRAEHESSLEMFRSVIESGRTALTSCILVNGGATVALLAYLGNLLSKNPDATAPKPLVLGLINFAVAVLLGALATGLRYLSQATYNGGHDLAGLSFTVASAVFVAAAYVLFGIGVWNAYVAFT
jgi:hypothetical protein